MEELDVHEPTKALTVVLWKWGTKYTAHHVNALARSLTQHLSIPHTVVCITDDPVGLDSTISTLPLPDSSGRGNARRLWIFSDEAKILGERVLQLDLDMVVVADITPLVDRPDPFVVWYCEAVGRIGFALNPSMMLMNTGVYPHIWEAYKATGNNLIFESNRNGCAATDQAVITYMLTVPDPRYVDVRGQKQLFRTRRPIVPTWNKANGVVSFRSMRRNQHHLPCGTRIVSFHGPHDQANYTNLSWVKKYWDGQAIESEPLELTPLEA